jgi:hypothetical protein
MASTLRTMGQPAWRLVGATILSVFAVAAMVASSAQASMAQDAESAEPTKADLINALDAILPLLVAEDYAGAAEHVFLPKDVEPKVLASIVKNQELSAAGIRKLEKEAKFGSAIELFGEDRATRFAERMGGVAEKCWAFNHAAGDVTGEVIAQWDGEKFRLIRIDDVGKFSAVAKAAVADKNPPVVTAPGTASPMAQPKPTRAELIQKAAMKIPELEAVVSQTPGDISAREKLAMSYLQIGNAPAAWLQLMSARKIDPKHVGVGRGIDVLIRKFSNQGIFTVGVPTETIKALLGEPEQVVDLKGRTRWLYAYWGVDFEKDRVHEIVDLRGVTQALYLPTEVVKTQLGGETWLPGFRRKIKGRAIACYFVPGETVASHAQMVTVERMLGVVGENTMQQLVNRVIADEAKEILGSQHKILKLTDETAFVAVTMPATEGSKPRHQLVRLFKGPQDLHRLTYMMLSDTEPTTETQKKWFDIFAAAKLVEVK